MTSAEDLRTLITVDPEIVSGTPVFRGTRVPIKNLFDHLGAGDSIDAFLDSFPSVSREQALALLKLAGSVLCTSMNGPTSR